VLPSVDLRHEFYGRNPDSLSLLRKTSETERPGFSISASAYKNFGGVQLGAGIMYRQMYTALSYNIVQNTQYETTDTAYYRNEYYDYFLSGDWLVTGYGDSVFVRYTDSLLQSELIPQVITNSRTQTQYYTSKGTAISGFVSLPLSIRKPFPINEKSAIWTEATSELSIRLFSKVPTEKGGLAPEFDMHNVFWYGSLSGGYEYRLANESSILISCRISVSAQSLYTSSQSTNYRTISSFGIGYCFGK